MVCDQGILVAALMLIHSFKSLTEHADQVVVVDDVLSSVVERVVTDSIHGHVGATHGAQQPNACSPPLIEQVGR